MAVPCFEATQPNDVGGRRFSEESLAAENDEIAVEYGGRT
jgi:hypothetical protein